KYLRRTFGSGENVTGIDLAIRWQHDVERAIACERCRSRTGPRARAIDVSRFRIPRLCFVERSRADLMSGLRVNADCRYYANDQNERTPDEFHKQISPTRRLQPTCEGRSRELTNVNTHRLREMSPTTERRGYDRAIGKP